MIAALVALVIVAVIFAAGLVVLMFVTRDAYRTRDQWAEEDRAAGEDLRRGVADKDFWAGPPGF